MQIHKKYTKISGKKIVLFFVFVFSVLGIGWVSATNLVDRARNLLGEVEHAAGMGGSIGNSLQNKLEKIFDSIDNKVSGKAVIQDLYQNSLQTVQNDKLKPLSDAIGDTVLIINQTYNCNLYQADIINVLYYYNNEFARDIKNFLGKNISIPTKSDMQASCNNFNNCVATLNNEGEFSVKSNASTNELCGSVFSSVFINAYLNRQKMESVGEKTKNGEYFWNGSLDDSAYDLLVDVYDLANVLFEEVEETPEILFYEMPKISNVDSVYHETPQTQVNRFSPYNTTGTTVTTGSTFPGVNGFTGLNRGLSGVVLNPIGGTGGQTGQSLTGIIAINGFDDDLDDDVNNFIEVVNANHTSVSNVKSITLGNACVSGFSYQFYETGVYRETGYITTATGRQLTPQEYLEDITSEINDLQCNSDFVCQSREKPSCPDCMGTTVGTGDLNSIEVQSIIRSIASLSGGVLDSQTVQCLVNCHETQPSLDSKIMCMAKCLCNTIESPYFDPVEYPGLGPVFRLKYCVVPVLEHSIGNTKKAYNIETIFTEINNLFQRLRDSGELLVSEKTKSFMDSSFKSMNIAENTSFLITSDKKSHTSQNGDRSDQAEQLENNTQLMVNVLGFGEDADLDDEINKYVVADSPCNYLDDIVSSNPDSAELNRLQCLSSRKKQQNQAAGVGEQVVEIVQNEKIIGLNNEFSEFLSFNSNFWKQVSDMMDEFEIQAQILSKKPRNE